MENLKACPIQVRNFTEYKIFVHYAAVHNWWNHTPNVIVHQDFVQAEGNDYVSGTFRMKILDEEIVISFDTRGDVNININIQESGTRFRAVGDIHDRMAALKILDTKNEK